MLSEKEFENLLSNPESSILDFKLEFYDFQNDLKRENTSKFIKDVVSFSNTIREETAYILFGIKEQEDKTLKLVGIERNVDEAILQEKVKDSVLPRPEFSYYEIDYQGKLFGVLEIPVTKHEYPIVATKQLKGLETGKVYYRRGSSNSEANALETIRINDWLRSLPSLSVKDSLSDAIAPLLSKLTDNSTNLSEILTEVYSTAKRFKSKALETHCSQQLQRIPNSQTDQHGYRVQKVFVSLKQIELNPFMSVASSAIKTELSKREDFFQVRLFFNQSILEIGQWQSDFGSKSTTFGTIKISSETLFPNTTDKSYPVYVYIFPNTISNLIRGIRQKTIDVLMMC